MSLYDSAVQLAVDSSACAHGAANHAATLQAARHLRWEHSWGRRRVAQRLGVTESWVKHYVDSFKEEA